MDDRARRTPHELLPAAGPGAPPRRNGELVFQAPWESRAFGTTLALYERGAFAWSEFQRALIGAIGAWERAHPDRDDLPYYRCWLQALERVLDHKGLCPTAELRARVQTFAERPHGHDHPRPQGETDAH